MTNVNRRRRWSDATDWTAAAWIRNDWYPLLLRLTPDQFLFAPFFHFTSSLLYRRNTNLRILMFFHIFYYNFVLTLPVFARVFDLRRTKKRVSIESWWLSNTQQYLARSLLKSQQAVQRLFVERMKEPRLLIHLSKRQKRNRRELFNPLINTAGCP